MSEPTKIEPYYQAQGKQLVDCLFDKGFLSESLNRDGMDAIEGLLAFFMQTTAQSAARAAEITKKYKATAKQREGEDPARSEEEMRWIARAKEAEGRLRDIEAHIKQEASSMDRLDPVKTAKWALEVGAFLKKTLSHPFPPISLLTEASRLLTTAVELGIIPEPDCRSGKIWQVRPEGSCVCPPTAPFPGQVIPDICPKCGGRRMSLGVFAASFGEICNNIHDSGAGPTRCDLPFGHSGPHEGADKRDGWG